MKGGLNVIQVISLDIASAILMGYMLYTLPVCRLSDIFLGVGGILYMVFCRVMLQYEQGQNNAKRKIFRLSTVN